MMHIIGYKIIKCFTLFTYTALALCQPFYKVDNRLCIRFNIALRVDRFIEEHTITLAQIKVLSHHFDLILDLDINPVLSNFLIVL